MKRIEIIIMILITCCVLYTVNDHPFQKTNRTITIEDKWEEELRFYFIDSNENIYRIVRPKLTFKYDVMKGVRYNKLEIGEKYVITSGVDDFRHGYTSYKETKKE